MAIAIGKRKREEGSDKTGNSSDDEGALRAQFQRAFEAKFKPLARQGSLPGTDSLDDADEETQKLEESDWSGLSDDGEESIRVIEHESIHSKLQDQQNGERKKFMSSKPPISNVEVVTITKPEASTPEEDLPEATNLKHDMALQRLLKESHLLRPNALKRTTSGPDSKGRLKALDLRMKDLGAKQSLSVQQKMPLSHRKGISEKAASREQTRRRDAADNGVILERAKAVTKPAQRREKGIGGPGLGQFKGGTLRLSSRDVRSIEGPKQGGKGRRKG